MEGSPIVTAPAAAPPVLPALPGIPIPTSGDTLTIALWTAGMAFYYACTPAGQKMAEAALEGTQAFNQKLSALVGHIETFFSKLHGKSQ